jgi:hypothetical protein
MLSAPFVEYGSSAAAFAIVPLLLSKECEPRSRLPDYVSPTVAPAQIETMPEFELA